MGQMCEWNLKKKFNWGHFFQNWGQKIILRSRKSDFLGIILTPGAGKWGAGVDEGGVRRRWGLVGP